MAPKRAATKAAPAKPKANTKAKVTKPAPPAKTKPATATTKKTKGSLRSATTTAAAPKKAPATKTAPPKKAPATKAPPKKAAATEKKTTTTAAPKKAPAKKAAPKKAAPKKAPASTKAATSKKRKAEEETPAPAPASKAAKKTAPKKAPASTKTATSKKRKAEDENPAPVPAKKTKVITKGAVINEPPTQRLNVYVFGEGTAGELGLGTPKNAIDVKRPRLNANLASDKVGVVQIAAGGMHVIALTHDNKILTWGVNDSGALGRDTQWDGGLKDVDAAEDSDDEDDNDNGLNPRESMPGEADFSTTGIAEGTRWVQVTAGDSCSFALTDDGRVYGWGTFRANEGVLGFNPTTETQYRPILIPELKNITSIAAGANHALALDTKGAVFAWGSGQQMQLGRRVVERTKTEGLKPREFGLPKGAKKGIVKIETGSYHCFAIDKSGNVYSWGLNNFGETGIPDNAGEDDAVIGKPRIVDALKGMNITTIKGGGHHSIAATESGDCLVWGRIDGNQIGIALEEINKLGEDLVIRDQKNDPRILKVPQKVTAIKGATVEVAASSDHNVAITKEGRAWSWGFSANYQTGQGQVDDVLVATMIDNTAVREQKLNYAAVGGQFGMVTSPA